MTRSLWWPGGTLCFARSLRTGLPLHSTSAATTTSVTITAFYFCCCRCHHHHPQLLLSPPLLTATVNLRLLLASPPPPSSAIALHHDPPPPPHCCNNWEFSLHCTMTATMATTTTTMTTMKTTSSGLQMTNPSHFPVSVGTSAAQWSRQRRWWWQRPIQTVEAKVRNNQQSKSKTMGAKRTEEVWRRPLADDGDMVTAIVKATWQQRRRQWRWWWWQRWGRRQQW
jgi:hypothetical protein